MILLALIPPILSFLMPSYLHVLINLIRIGFIQKLALYQNTKWRSRFVFLKPLLGLVFNSQKYNDTFVNWYLLLWSREKKELRSNHLEANRSQIKQQTDKK
jgi:hypothetical protein